MLTEVPKSNVIEARFGAKGSVIEQLQDLIEAIKSGDVKEPEHTIVILAYNNPAEPMVVIEGGHEQAHPLFITGLLEAAKLMSLDQLAEMQDPVES